MSECLEISRNGTSVVPLFPRISSKLENILKRGRRSRALELGLFFQALTTTSPEYLAHIPKQSNDLEVLLRVQLAISLASIVLEFLGLELRVFLDFSPFKAEPYLRTLRTLLISQFKIENHKTFNPLLLPLIHLHFSREEACFEGSFRSIPSSHSSQQH